MRCTVMAQENPVCSFQLTQAHGAADAQLGGYRSRQALRVKQQLPIICKTD